jgi:hypothetical protein
MATYRHQLGQHERRRLARIAPDLLTYASFGGSNGGMVLDVSERGLAVVTALAVPAASVLQLSIAADETHGAMEVTGRVTWISESRRRLGIELIEVAGDARSAWELWTAALLAQRGAAEGNEQSLASVQSPIPAGIKTPALPVPFPVPVAVPSPTLLPHAVPDGGRWALVGTENAVRAEQVAPRAPTVAMSAISAPGTRTPAANVPKRSLELVAGKESAVSGKPAPETAAGLGAVDRTGLLKADVSKWAATRAAATTAVATGTGASRTELFKADAAGGEERADEVASQPTSPVPSQAANVLREAGSPLPYARKWLILAISVVVAGSFGLGTFIGRSVLGRTGQQIDRRSAATPPSVAARSAGTSGTTEKTGPRDTAASHEAVTPATSATTASSSDSTMVNAKGADATGVDAKGVDATQVQGVGRESSRELGAGRGTDTNKEVAGAAAEAGSGAAGAELLVTPKEGDEQLHIALPAEVLMSTPSMEMTLRRSALLPGAKAGPHHKIREERLLVGALLERVTPQPRPEALAAAGTQGAEQVVSVRVTIEGDGHVSYVDPVGGPMMLMPSVMEAVREWKFGASTLGKDAIQTQADLTIKFRPKR